MDNGKKIGFIGFGNMAQAIAKGLLEAKVCKAEQLYACAAHFEKLKDTADRLGVHPMQTAQEVVQNSDVVILAVKPYLIEQVVAPLKHPPHQHHSQHTDCGRRGYHDLRADPFAG